MGRATGLGASRSSPLRSARLRRYDSDIRPLGIRPRLISRVRAVRVAALDAFLLPSAFISIGATVGVLGAQSLIILLRTWHIWYLSPAESNIASIGGACVFGALWFLLAEVGPRQETELTPARRWILIGSLLLFVLIVGGLVAVISLTTVSPGLLRMVTFPRMLGALLVAHGVGAVILAEVIRLVFPRASRWSDRQHYAAICVGWTLCSTVGASLLWRTWTKLPWP